MRDLFLALVLFFLGLGSAAYVQTCPSETQLQMDLPEAYQATAISMSEVNPIECIEITMSPPWAGSVYSPAPQRPTRA